MRRFHDAYPPLLLADHKETNLENSATGEVDCSFRLPAQPRDPACQHARDDDPQDCQHQAMECDNDAVRPNGTHVGQVPERTPTARRAEASLKTTSEEVGTKQQQTMVTPEDEHRHDVTTPADGEDALH